MICSRTLTAVIVLFCTLALSGFVRAQEPEPAPKGPKPKPVVYAVVQVDDEVRIVEKAAVAELKKELAASHKQAVAEWTKAKKEAQKAGEEFTDPKPEKPAFKVVAASVKTREEAETIAAKARGGDGSARPDVEVRG